MWKPYATDYFWGWKVYLPVFSGWPIGSVINKNWDFKGCGGNSVWDLDTIEVRCLACRTARSCYPPSVEMRLRESRA